MARVVDVDVLGQAKSKGPTMQPCTSFLLITSPRHPIFPHLQTAIAFAYCYRLPVYSRPISVALAFATRNRHSIGFAPLTVRPDTPRPLNTTTTTHHFRIGRLGILEYHKDDIVLLCNTAYIVLHLLICIPYTDPNLPNLSCCT